MSAVLPRLGLHLPAKVEPLKHERSLLKKLLLTSGSRHASSVALKTQDVFTNFPCVVTRSQLTRPILEELQREPKPLNEERRAKMTRKQLRQVREAREEFRKRLDPRSDHETREVMATIQIMSLEDVPGALPTDCSGDQILTLYREEEGQVYFDPSSHMFGRRVDARIGENEAEYHAELLAMWFMQLFQFLQQAGADFHPLSPLHALFN
ncbi:unnamed protein product, partial [Amoebophrya sp. A25]|eukprot:GSA25T00020106001.1